MTRWLIIALVFVLLAALWSATHPPQKWDAFPTANPVPDDELLSLNPV
jgi:hypothetical protein